MSLRPSLACSLILAVLAGPAFAGAVVEGSVALPHTRSVPVMNKRYEIVTKGGVLATNPPLAVVYLAGDFPPPASPPVAQMAQKELTFLPALLPVQAGTKVEFPNFDDTYHNIFSYSAPKRFDLGRYRPEERPVPTQVFDVAGLVTSVGTAVSDSERDMRAMTEENENGLAKEGIQGASALG